ncbi:DUF4249 domain-containing protein [Roseivirga pacifica]|nr:DUF4249 domain-containing protein [Roseivirga pacifica]
MKHIKTITLTIMLLACSSPFEFEHINSVGQQLVIEGYLTNLNGRRHSVRINRPVAIDNKKNEAVEYVRNAIVNIVDDQGGVIELKYYKDGLYQTDSLAKAVPGKVYKLIVETEDGQRYESAYEALSKPSSNPARINFRYDQVEQVIGDEVFLDSMVVISAHNDSWAEEQYYRWEIGEYFIIDADRMKDRNTQTSPSIEEELGRREQRFRNCFVRDYSPEVLPLFDVSNQKLLNNSSYDIHNITLNGRFEQQFVIEAYQLSLSQEAFSYWRALKDLVSNQGGIFDTAPYPVKGNINRVDADGKSNPILGYFGVHSASVDRVFITLEDLGIYGVTYNETCLVSSLLDTCGPGQACADFGYWLHPCYDCRSDENYFENYKNKPPKWWRERFE